MARILVVDNYDSFVFNLVHYLAQIGAEVTVLRNDDPDLVRAVTGDSDLTALASGLGSGSPFDGILLSPGPGTPEAAGVCVDLIGAQAGRIPLFGVCLGLQAMAVAFGGRVDRAPELLHGKTSQVFHDDSGCLAGLPNPFTATRYHSLAVLDLPEQMVPTAHTEGGVLMAARHRELPVEAVQYHPESVLTEGGYQMLANWLAVCGDADAPRRAASLSPLVADALR